MLRKENERQQDFYRSLLPYPKDKLTSIFIVKSKERASLIRTIEVEKRKSIRKKARLKQYKNELKERAGFDIHQYVDDSRDVFETKEEVSCLVHAINSSLKWAKEQNVDERKKLDELQKNYDNHKVSMQRLYDELQILEEDIDVIKKRIREFDSEEKKDK